MVNFSKLESEIREKVGGLLKEAEDHEPAIEDAVVQALGDVGAPPALASAAGDFLGAILDHFRSVPGPAETVPAKAAEAAKAPTEAPTEDTGSEPTASPVDTSAWAPATPASPAAASHA
jgi:hypothetical protein